MTPKAREDEDKEEDDATEYASKLNPLGPPPPPPAAAGDEGNGEEEKEADLTMLAARSSGEAGAGLLPNVGLDVETASLLVASGNNKTSAPARTAPRWTHAYASLSFSTPCFVLVLEEPCCCCGGPPVHKSHPWPCDSHPSASDRSNT